MFTYRFKDNKKGLICHKVQQHNTNSIDNTLTYFGMAHCKMVAEYQEYKNQTVLTIQIGKESVS